MKMKMKIEFKGRIDKVDVIAYVAAVPAGRIAYKALKDAIQPKGLIGQGMVVAAGAIVECTVEQGVKKIIRKIEAKKEGKKIKDDSEDYVVVEFA